MITRAAILLMTLVASACASEERTETPARAADPSASAAQPAVARPRIVAFGDSLTAGLGLKPEESYPALLQQRVNEAGLNYEVVNAGVSGDTSAGGLRRVDWALEGDVKVLIVALGGNDGLRGLPAEELSRNLSAIIERAESRGIRVVLAGMEAPPNFGAGYTAAFHQVYADLAAKYDVVFVRFLLDGVAGLSHMNQSDGIHPTAEGARRIADNLWPALYPILTPHD